MSAQEWYQQTHAEMITDPDKHCLIPLIFYIDETGTDVFQRYPLEPLMFMFGILQNFVREKSLAWRHAGFIPKVSKSKKSGDSLQLYHDCMAMVLSTLKPLQDNPPLEWLQFGDEPKVQKELIMPIAFVMGDQKSQDNLVGRKSNNSGWAGRSHRGCMCSGPSSSDPCLRCKPVPKEVLDNLREISFTSDLDSPTMQSIQTKLPLGVFGNKKKQKSAHDFVKRRAGLATDILSEVFTMHPLRNAWDPMCFGCNKNGIIAATLDDPTMHYNEAGLFDGVAKAFYGCFTEEEKQKFEGATRSLVLNSRSSVRKEFPKTRISKGFTNCTLNTANEKVGSLMTASLTLQNDETCDMMVTVGERQQERYLSFPVNITSSTTSSDKSNPTKPKATSKSKNKMKNTSSATEEDDNVEVRGSYKLLAGDQTILKGFPSRRNYTYGRDRSTDAKKKTFLVQPSHVEGYSDT